MTLGKIDEALQLASALGHDPILLHASPLGPWATFKSNWVSRLPTLLLEPRPRLPTL